MIKEKLKEYKGKWEQSMVKERNYPLLNTLTMFMFIPGATILTILFVIGINNVPTLEYAKANLIAFSFFMACFFVYIWGLTAYMFYDTIYKPMKTYQEKYGSCGLGDEWLAKRKAKSK